MPDISEGERVRCTSCGREVTVPDRDPTLQLVQTFVKTQCPKCGKPVKMSSALAGSQVPCLRCGATVRLPRR